MRLPEVLALAAIAVIIFGGLRLTPGAPAWGRGVRRALLTWFALLMGGVVLWFLTWSHRI